VSHSRHAIWIVGLLEYMAIRLCRSSSLQYRDAMSNPNSCKEWCAFYLKNKEKGENMMVGLYNNI
jgi:hypothetical protein